jgi:hypothetical protein
MGTLKDRYRKFWQTFLSQGREITDFATPIKTDDTNFRLANATFRTLVQPFQKTFTQKGGVEIIPNEIRKYRFKIDDEFMPDELYATWLGFLTQKSVDRKDWPFVKWLIEVYYARQIDQVESFTDSIAEVYQGIKMNVFMSRYWYKKYMQDKRAQGFYQRTSDKDIDGKIDFTPLDVKPLACMVGTSDIFCTPAENFIHISPATLTKNQFKLEEAKRAVAVMADWSEGPGFGINEAVWTNIRPTV